MLSIQFEKRDMKAKAATLRKKGSIPAVFYGPKETSTPIVLNESQFKKVWKEAGESSIVTLNHGSEEHEALIQDVDVHPVSGAPRHVDFYVIEKGKKLQVGIPLEFTGVSPVVKDQTGTLVKVLHELEIEALPKDLPHDLTVDISSLATLDSQILAKDIALPAGVTLITEPEEVVAAIAEVKEEVEEVAAPSIEDIEVVGQKGKKDEEEGADAGAAPKAEKAEKSEKKE